MIARSNKCSIKLTEDALMYSECKKMVDINPILQVKLEYPEPEHTLETQFDNNEDVNDDDDEDFSNENTIPEEELKTECIEVSAIYKLKTLSSQYKIYLNSFSHQREVKVKRGRGRP